MPEIVSLAGDIVSGVVIPQWNELPVAGVLSEIAPVRVEADVRAAAFAETVLGAGQGYDYLVFVTVGTGISYTAVYAGRPSRVAGRGAEHRHHGAGRPVAGGSRTPRRAARPGAGADRLGQRAGRALRRPRRRGTAGRDVLAAAQRGDQAAAEVLDEGARTLGIAIALLVNVLDPEAVIVGGGLGSADTSYWQATRDYARQYLHDFAAGPRCCAAPWAPTPA